METPTAEDKRLSSITSEQEVQQAVKSFRALLTEVSTESNAFTLGRRGGSNEVEAHWLSHEGIWVGVNELESRYFHAFGLGNPFGNKNPSIIAEINFPFEGTDRRVAGVFLKDEEGRIFVAHRGKVGGGRPGIGMDSFLSHVDKNDQVIFGDGGVQGQAIILGALDDPELIHKIRDFVMLVDKYKSAAVQSNGVWWVNQGQSYSAEREGGFIWAPLASKNGNTLVHHENVSRVQIGDVVVHYSSGKIVALGEVQAAPVEAVKPSSLGGHDWQQSGWQSSVNYWDIEKPIALGEIPQELRAPYSGGPFNKVHAVNQGYLYRLSHEVAETLKNEFQSRWPDGSPWYAQDSDGTPLHVLLKWKKSTEVATIERHKEIAEQRGSVWWGKFGSGKVSRAKIERLRNQIARGITTHAYLYRQGEVWQASLVGATDDPGHINKSKLPTYYSAEDCAAFFELKDFQSIPHAWPAENLVLASKPSEPQRMPGALGNQATPLFVYQMNDPKKHQITPEADLPTMDWLIQETLWEPDALEELCRDLQTLCPQIVLAGPPGTGKTWVAMKIAHYLTKGNPLATRTVQFHPSYGYEEFIQGLRPVVDKTHGGIKFDLVDGVVLQMVNAMGDASDMQILVIDEMNRANLPRVFGELMYLFEYRDQDHSIDLQYSSDFSLPSNLKFIATMNTADRSIRSIDLALRRRFEVFECPPDVDILRKFYDSGRGVNEVASLADGFERLNSRLEELIDRHHTIGQTFFMQKELTPERLRKIWKRRIGPLIEEYFFDQPDIAAEFSISAFWPEVDD